MNKFYITLRGFALVEGPHYSTRDNNDFLHCHVVLIIHYFYKRMEKCVFVFDKREKEIPWKILLRDMGLILFKDIGSTESIWGNHRTLSY